MHDRSDGFTWILKAKSILRHSGWRPIILLTAMVAITCAVVFEVWMLLLPAMLLPYAEARWHQRLQASAGVADAFRGFPMESLVPAPIPAAAPHDACAHNHRPQISPVADWIVRHHPNLPAARLVKASMLWYFNGDAEGARCHCREILGRIQREDPLFEQVCDLYMQTHDSAIKRRMSPARNIAADAGRPDRPAAVGRRPAKIIPLPSRRLSPPALQ